MKMLARELMQARWRELDSRKRPLSCERRAYVAPKRLGGTVVAPRAFQRMGEARSSASSDGRPHLAIGEPRSARVTAAYERRTDGFFA